MLVSRASSRDWWLIERVAGDFLASRVIASLRLSAGQGRPRFRQCTGQLARVWPRGGWAGAGGERAVGLAAGGEIWMHGCGEVALVNRSVIVPAKRPPMGSPAQGPGSPGIAAPRGCRSPRARSCAWGGCARGVDNYLLVKLASSGVLRVHGPLLEATIKMAGTRAGSAVRSSQRRGRRALSGGQDRWPAIRSSAYPAGRPGCGIPPVPLRLGRHSRLGCHGWVAPGRWGRIPDGGDARAG